MAISKKQKKEIVTQYTEWINRSKALFVTDYRGLTVKESEELRRKVRQVGGEFHIIKNTLGKLAFESTGLPLHEEYFVGCNAIGFAFEDAPGMARALTDFARSSNFLEIKGGYLGENLLQPDDVMALAKLPPLPVMRAQLLGTIMAPASRLARTLAEPARQIASVLKAFAKKDSAEATD